MYKALSIIEFLLTFYRYMFSSTVALEEKQLAEIVQTADKFTDTNCPWTSIRCIQGRAGWTLLSASIDCCLFLVYITTQEGRHTAGSE